MLLYVKSPCVADMLLLSELGVFLLFICIVLDYRLYHVIL